jgi:hypothetical protein
MEKAFNVIRAQIQDPLSMASSKVSSILIGEEARLNATQKNILRNIYEEIQKASETIDFASLPASETSPR